MIRGKPDAKLPPNHMRVAAQGNSVNYLKYGEYILSNPDYNDLIILGTGQAMEVAVKIAE